MTNELKSPPQDGQQSGNRSAAAGSTKIAPDKKHKDEQADEK